MANDSQIDIIYDVSFFLVTKIGLPINTINISRSSCTNIDLIKLQLIKSRIEDRLKIVWSGPAEYK